MAQPNDKVHHFFIFFVALGPCELGIIVSYLNSTRSMKSLSQQHSNFLATLSHGRIRTQDVQLSSRMGCTPGHSAIPSIKIKADQFQTLASQTWPHWRSLTYRETCSRLASLPCFPASAAASSSSSCPTTGSRASEKPPSCRCRASGS